MIATISSYSSCSTTTLEFNAFKSSFNTLSASVPLASRQNVLFSFLSAFSIPTLVKYAFHFLTALCGSQAFLRPLSTNDRLLAYSIQFPGYNLLSFLLGASPSTPGRSVPHLAYHFLLSNQIFLVLHTKYLYSLSLILNANFAFFHSAYLAQV